MARAIDCPSATDDRPATLRLPVADLVVVFGVLIFGTNVLEVTLRGGAMEAFIGYVYMACYAAGFGLAIVSGAVPKALLRNPLLTVLLCMPLLSILWSVDPGMTRFRTLMLIGTSAFGLFIGWHYDRTALLRLLAIGVSLNLVLSAALIVAVPAIGIDQTGAWAGTWVGAFMHKNGLGAATGIATLILFYAIATSTGLLRIGFLVAFAVAAVLLVGSKSATSLLVAIIGLLLASGFVLWRRAPGLTMAWIFAGILFLPILASVLMQKDMVVLLLDSLEKDMTVHGRTEIWELVWPYIMDRFWLGYGYGSFWQEGFPWFSQLQARLHYTPFYSHNGIVELWIAGGALSVGLAVLVFLGTMLKAALLGVRERTSPDAPFALVFLVCFALRNVTESSLLQSNDFLWLLFVALVVSTSKSVVFSLRPLEPAPTGDDPVRFSAAPTTSVRDAV